MFLKTTSQESFYAPECFLGSVACKFWIRCIIWDLLQILTLFLLGHFHHHPDPNLCDDKNNPFTLLYSGPAGQYKKVGGHPGHFLQFCGRHLQTFSHKSVHWHIFIKECTYVVLGEPPTPPKKKKERKKDVFWGEFSQMLPTHPSHGYCEIWEHERWHSGRKRRFSGWFIFFEGFSALFGNHPPHPPTFGRGGGPLIIISPLLCWF